MCRVWIGQNVTKEETKMSNELVHRIDLSNLRTGDHVSHSIVLVKGKIASRDSCGDHILIENANSNETFRSDEVRKVCGTISFKCLVQLVAGENVLTLKYDSIEQQLTLYHDDPGHPKFILKLYYIICTGHDGTFQSIEGEANSAEIACKRITLAVQLIQCLFADKLREAGFTRKTFQFVACEKFFSSLSLDVARTWNASQLWRYHAMEMLGRESETNRNVKYVCILAGSVHDSPNSLMNVALGAGYVAVYGSGCLYAWPSQIDQVIKCFRNKRKVDRAKLMDDSMGRGTFGGCFATTLGSLCHEIGHIFDLGHTDGGIMGTGFDFVNRFFTIETRTVLLAPRKMTNCHPMNDATVSDTRLTRVKKQNRFLAEYHSQRDSNDLTYFCDNCNVMLFHHKWFNQPSPDNDTTDAPLIQFNRTNRTVSSTNALRLVECRHKLNGMCLHYRIFDAGACDEFDYSVPTIHGDGDYEVLVMDLLGNLTRFWWAIGHERWTNRHLTHYMSTNRM